jgi:hypothetical protein
MSDRRFLRGKGLRNALYVAQDARCARCGGPLRAGWHADHRLEPYSTSGRTNVHEMQALCPNCHREKHARPGR